MTYAPGTLEFQVNEYIERSAHFVTIPAVLLKRLLESHEEQRAEIERLRREVASMEAAMAAERGEIERVS